MSAPLNQCTQCQKTLSLPFVGKNLTELFCLDCFGKIEKPFRGERLFAYYETKIDFPDGQMGWKKEKNAWISFWYNKVVYSPQEEEQQQNDNQDNKCTSCQGDFTKKDGKLLCWVEKGKEEIKMCCSCKEKFEKQGNSEALPSRFSDPGMEGGGLCGYCHKKVKECHEVIKDGEISKIIIKHDCQIKCGLLGGNCGKTFQLSQSYTDWINKIQGGAKSLDYSYYMCPDCRIEEVKRDINSTSNSQREARLKELLKELEKLTGKDNNDNSHRERERERQISQLRTRIAELEAIINRTTEQEQELQTKREELRKLKAQVNSEKQPTNYWPYIFGGIGILLVMGIIIYFSFKKKNVKRPTS